MSIQVITTSGSSIQVITPEGNAINVEIGGIVAIDATIIDGSANAVSGNAVFDSLALKQPLDADLSAYAADPTASILANMPDALLPGADPNVLNVSGITSPAGNASLDLNVVGFYQWGDEPAFLRWEFGEWSISHEDGKWVVSKVVGGFTVAFRAEKTSSSSTPVGLTGWTVTTGAAASLEISGGEHVPSYLGQLCVYGGVWYRWNGTGWDEDTYTAGDGIDITDNVISATGGTVDATIIDGSTNAVSGNAVFDSLALKAPLDSPVFTGSVTTSGDASIYTSGTYASIASYGAAAHIATYGTAAYIQSRATFKLFNGTHTTTLSHSPTANRAIAFPDAAGTVALINPSTGTQTFSGAQTFTNSAIGTGTGVAISGTASSGTILAVSGTASTSGSLFTVTQGSIGFRITETGALNYNGVVSLSRSGGADISLGGVNNSNLIRSNNTGSHTATDFVLRGGTADRTAGNLFEVRNFTQPVLTISALTGTGNVGIGTTTPAEKLSVVGNATVSGSLTVSGSTQFASTTRPTSSGTGTPTATSLITLADVDGRFGPRGKYDLDPQTVVLQQTLNTATAPVLGGRFGSTYSFNFGSPAGNPAGVVFVPFYITKIRTYTKCAIAITAGTSVADVLYGGIYLPDASGFPKTRLGDVWQWSCASVSNLVEATINVGEVSGLFYVALLPSKGAADWVTNNGTNLVVRATDQAGANAGFREVFNACPRDLSANVGAFGILATGGISSLPADMSSPEVRRPSSYSAVTHPVCILY